MSEDTKQLELDLDFPKEEEKEPEVSHQKFAPEEICMVTLWINF